jgi:putative ABC transport system permease protein
VRDWTAFVRERLRLGTLTPSRESRIVRELASQLEDFYGAALESGATDDEADAHARAQIQDWERLADDVRQANRSCTEPPIERIANAIEHVPVGHGGGRVMVADLMRDTRYAVRQLIKSPGFALVAILTMALGIGATSAIFSVINGVILRPLPYRDPDSLVRVNEIVPQYGRFSVAPASFLDWRTQTRSFETMAAFASSTATFSAAEGPERMTGASVSWDFFELLRTSAILGRTFTPDEDLPGKSNVVVLSHGTWQRRFGGDSSVIGRGITLSGAPVTIIGVMPAAFAFPRDAEYWQPIALDPANPPRGAHYLAVVARLKPNVTVVEAGTEMRLIAERLAQQYPESSANESAEVVPLLDQILGDIREPLFALLAAVGIVVLIACANVANLLLVRASVRDREIAIRTAIGASRGRLVRQMLVESLMLALAGGAAGVLIAYLALEPIQTLSAGNIPRVQDVAIDSQVLLFALVVSVATGMVFGLAPAWHASRADVAAIIKETGRSSSAAGGRWTRNALLVAEVALSIVLLVGATLLLRSFARLTDVDPGFRADNVLAFRVSLPQPTYPQPHTRVSFYGALIDKLEALPQVQSAGMVQALPMRGSYVLSVAIQGRPVPPGEEPSANHRVVNPGYFSTLGIPVKRGRTFSEGDTETAPMVAVIDEAFAARHFPDRDPIGQGIDIGNGTDGFYQIVGVVGDVHYSGLDANPHPTMYVPYRQDVFSTMWVLARTHGDPRQLASAARLAVREIDPALPAYSITPLADVISESVGQRRFTMLLLVVFASMALFLAAIGIYGVVAYAVSQRTQEIGVRLAIGAARRDVVTLIVGGGLKLALVGLIVGLGGALALSRLIEGMLFNLTPFDPVSYVATAAVLLTVAALACYVPARRALRVDPLVAIRQQ